MEKNSIVRRAAERDVTPAGPSCGHETDVR